MAVSSYDDIAEWYDAFVGDVPLLADPFFPTVQQLIGAVEGLRVCDLACGQGRVARHLVSRVVSLRPKWYTFASGEDWPPEGGTGIDR